MACEEWGPRGEEPGEHAEQAPVGDAADLGKAEVGGVERQRQGLAVEVAPGEHSLLLGENERIVGASIEFNGQAPAQVVDRVVAGAVHLGGAAQRVRILNSVAKDM